MATDDAGTVNGRIPPHSLQLPQGHWRSAIYLLALELLIEVEEIGWLGVFLDEHFPILTVSLSENEVLGRLLMLVVQFHTVPVLLQD